MPSFGLGEILIILIAIVLFVQPDDLPKFIRNLGRVYGDFQRFLVRMRSMSQETLSELAQIEERETPKMPMDDEILGTCESKKLDRNQSISALESSSRSPQEKE